MPAVKTVTQRYSPDNNSLRLLDQFRHMINDYLIISLQENATSLKTLSLKAYRRLAHYEVMGDHFSNIEGYDAYAKAAEVLRRVGESGFLKMFMGAATWGTPDMILAKLEERRELLGSYEHTVAFRYGGIPYEEATASMRLFASEVLPVIQSWN